MACSTILQTAIAHQNWHKTPDDPCPDRELARLLSAMSSQWWQVKADAQNFCSAAAEGSPLERMVRYDERETSAG